MAKKDEFLQWQQEDAERLNELAEFAHKNKLTVEVGDSLEPPALNEDGSLVNKAKKKLKDLVKYFNGN